VCGRIFDRNIDDFPENWKPFHQYSVRRLGYYIYLLGLYRQVGRILAVWLILAQWLIQAGMADTSTVACTSTMAYSGTVAYTGRYGGY